MAEEKVSSVLLITRAISIGDFEFIGTSCLVRLAATTLKLKRNH